MVRFIFTLFSHGLKLNTCPLEITTISLYQIKKAPKAAIEEADSADKRNKGSQEVNEQIE